MADEKEVKKEVETEKVDTDKKEVEESKKPDEVEKTAEDKKEEVEETKKEEKTEEEVPAEAPEMVAETEPTGNGLNINDIVTKDMLAERLAAFEAKFDAIMKENQDLKDQLSAKNDELNGMKDKYENKDFGNFTKQGVMQKDKFANSSFDEYSRAFMQY